MREKKRKEKKKEIQYIVLAEGKVGGEETGPATWLCSNKSMRFLVNLEKNAACEGADLAYCPQRTEQKWLQQVFSQKLLPKGKIIRCFGVKF